MMVQEIVMQKKQGIMGKLLSPLIFIIIGVSLVFTPEYTLAAESMASEIEHLLGSSSMSSRLLQIFILLTVLGIAPSILIMVTSFVRISIPKLVRNV